jgi:hypothetical protein
MTQTNMKPIVIYSDKFLNAISIFMRVAGISLFPFVILREKYRDAKYWSKKNDIIVNHETIHFWQTLELGIVLFYVLYVVEFLIKLAFYGGNAYKNLSFEREAKGNEKNLKYLDNRKPYAWIKLIFKQ